MSSTCRCTLECVNSKNEILIKKTLFYMNSMEGPNGNNVVEISAGSGPLPCGNAEMNDENQTTLKGHSRKKKSSKRRKSTNNFMDHYKKSGSKKRRRGRAQSSAIHSARRGKSRSRSRSRNRSRHSRR